MFDEDAMCTINMVVFGHLHSEILHQVIHFPFPHKNHLYFVGCVFKIIMKSPTTSKPISFLFLRPIFLKTGATLSYTVFNLLALLLI